MDYGYKLAGKNSHQTNKVLNSLFLHEPWTIGMEAVRVVKSFSDLDPPAASAYFEQIAAWASDKYGAKLNPPGPTAAN